MWFTYKQKRSGQCYYVNTLFLGRLFTYIWPIVYQRQNFLKVVVHVIIIDQFDQNTNQIAHWQNHSRASLVAVTSECCW